MRWIWKEKEVSFLLGVRVQDLHSPDTSAQGNCAYGNPIFACSMVSVLWEKGGQLWHILLCTSLRCTGMLWVEGNSGTPCSITRISADTSSVLPATNLDTISHCFGVISGVWLAAKHKAFNSDNLITTSFLAGTFICGELEHDWWGLDHFLHPTASSRRDISLYCERSSNDITRIRTPGSVHALTWGAGVACCTGCCGFSCTCWVSLKLSLRIQSSMAAQIFAKNLTPVAKLCFPFWVE